jgi:cathepsin C
MTISHWQTIESNEDAVAEALVSQGPLSIIMDATQLSYYKGGIWNGHFSGEPAALGCHNDFESTNHAVLLVGYGVESSGQKYWIVKNSWGTGWGEEGYFRIARSSESLCAIYSDVTTSLI